MTDGKKKAKRIQVKASLIVDVIAERVAAGRVQELRAFVQDKGIREEGTFIIDLIAALVAAGHTTELHAAVEREGMVARLSGLSVNNLKTFLGSEISRADGGPTAAARRAASSSEPCRPDN